MAGLLNPKGLPQGEQMPQGMQPQRMQRGATDPMNTEGQESNVSPEEQQQYDMFVGNAYKLIFGDERRLQTILQSLKATEDPKLNLANATAQVVAAVEQSAAKAGVQLSGDVLLHGGAEIMESLAEAAQKARIHDYNEDEMEGAFYQAVDMYREIGTQQGRVDPKMLQEDWAELEQLDQQGKLGEMMMKFAEQDEDVEA